MATNRLTGSNVTEFRPYDGGPPIQLHRFMQSVQDTIRPRLAVHEFLKVDGAQVERMGNSPSTYRFGIVYVDVQEHGEWLAHYATLVSRLKKSPLGTLTHPVFGAIKVACQGINGAAIDINQAINSITVPIEFIDADVDTSVAPAGVPSVEIRISDVLAAAAGFTSQASQFVTASALVTALVLSATEYAEAAQAVNTDGTEGATLSTQLGTVADDTNAAIEAIEADPANDAAATAYAAVAAAEEINAACILVDEALRESRPPLIEYVVGADTDILSLASLLYGPDAQNRIDEIFQLNPGLNPYAILGGTVLNLSTPTLV